MRTETTQDTKGMGAGETGDKGSAERNARARALRWQRARAREGWAAKGKATHAPEADPDAEADQGFVEDSTGDAVAELCAYTFTPPSQADIRETRARARAAATLDDPQAGILSAAYGRGWEERLAARRSRVAGVLGSGCASRAGRYIWRKRGVVVSDASLDDAGADAAEAMWTQWAGEFLACDAGQSFPEARATLWLTGYRAALASLDGNRRAGGRGRNGVYTVHSTETLTGRELELACESLAHWAGNSGVPPEPSIESTRRDVAAWIWSALVRPHAGTKGANAIRARDAAARQARALVRLVHGATWDDAARLTGYADGAALAHSLGRGKVPASLAEAAAREATASPVVRRLRAEWFALARRYAAARRTLRQVRAGADASGTLGHAPAVPSRRWVNAPDARTLRQLRARAARDVDGATVRDYRPGQLVDRPRPARRVRIVPPIAAQWRAAVDAKEAARAALVRQSRRVAAVLRMDADAWRKASEGLRGGHLRR